MNSTDANRLADFQTAQNSLMEAAHLYQTGDAPGASAVLLNGVAVLDGIKDDLADPSVADTLGKKLKKALKKVGTYQKKIAKVNVHVELGKKKAVAIINKLRSASKFGQKVANIIGEPVVQELNSKTAGFHGPGPRSPARHCAPASGASASKPYSGRWTART